MVGRWKRRPRVGVRRKQGQGLRWNSTVGPVPRVFSLAGGELFRAGGRSAQTMLVFVIASERAPWRSLAASNVVVGLSQGRSRGDLRVCEGRSRSISVLRSALDRLAQRCRPETTVLKDTASRVLIGADERKEPDHEPTASAELQEPSSILGNRTPIPEIGSPGPSEASPRSRFARLPNLIEVSLGNSRGEPLTARSRQVRPEPRSAVPDLRDLVDPAVTAGHAHRAGLAEALSEVRIRDADP